jgi:hypothetical protein
MLHPGMQRDASLQPWMCSRCEHCTKWGRCAGNQIVNVTSVTYHYMSFVSLRLFEMICCVQGLLHSRAHSASIVCIDLVYSYSCRVKSDGLTMGDLFLLTTVPRRQSSVDQHMYTRMGSGR